MPNRPAPVSPRERPRPVVSVIMIFFNAEAFIEEAITSVFAQTHPGWELLLVDDGSTDASTDIARHHAERQPDRVRYLEHPAHRNRGMSASRNLGIRHATGEYIAFLDADDVWLPQKLERQLVVLDRHPSARMVYGPSRLWFGWTGDPDDARRDDWRRPGVRPDVLYGPPRLLTLLLQGRVTTPATCSALLRRAAVEAVGGFEDSFTGLYEDQAFFAKVFYHAPVYVSGESWDRYRQHPDSACAAGIRTGAFHPDMPHSARLIFLTWLDSYLAAQGARGTPVWGALQRQLWLYRHPRIHGAFARVRLVLDTIVGWFWERPVPLVFRAGRRLLPLSLRERIWARWLGSRS